MGAPPQRSVQIISLNPSHGAALVELRREALTAAPLAFASSLEDDRFLSEGAPDAYLTNPNNAILGALDGDALVGMVGLYRADKLKARHVAGIWGMFVSPSARGRGVGAALLSAAVDWARALPGILQIHLSVTDAASEARRLYERAGFEEWGRQPRSMCYEGRFLEEQHLMLVLNPGEAGLK